MLDTDLVENWNPDKEADRFLFHRPVSKTQGEGDAFEFYREELRLAKVLGAAEASAANEAINAFKRATGLDAPKPVARKARAIDLERTVRDLDPIMRTAWTSQTEGVVADLISAITARGAKRAGAYKQFARFQSRPLIESGMVAAAKYSTNTYFNRVVMPAMINDIQQKAKDGKPFDDAFFREMQATLNRRLKSVPYWKNVASQASSRAYHYGMMRAGLQKGYRTYTLRAVVDERTSDVCLALNGKTFNIDSGVAYAERTALIDPDKMKDEAPWATIDRIEGKTAGQLVRAGISLPPFHFGGCRTTVDLNK